MIKIVSEFGMIKAQMTNPKFQIKSKIPTQEINQTKRSLNGHY
jgi:hypothetical protein